MKPCHCLLFAVCSDIVPYTSTKVKADKIIVDDFVACNLSAPPNLVLGGSCHRR